MTEARRIPDVALLALVQVVFGSLSVAGKLVIPEIGPFVLVAARTGFAAIVLVALERWLVAHRFARRDIAPIVGLSLVGVVLNQICFLYGLSQTTAVDATVLITTVPIFTLAVGLAWRKETWSAQRGLGIGVAFAGIVVLFWGSLSLSASTLLGDLFIVLNSLFYSIFLVASRPVLKRIPPLSLTAGTFAVAALITFPIGLLNLGSVQPGAPDAVGWAALVYIVLGPTVTTYFLVSHVLVRAPASKVAAFIYFQPLAGVILASLLLHETLGLREVAAAALIFTGVAVAAIGLRRPRAFVPAE